MEKLDKTKLTNEELIAIIEKKEKDEEQSLAQINKLKKEVASKKDLKATPSVDVDGITYDIKVASYISKEGAITAEQLIEDVELCKGLLEKGSHILVKREES